MEHIDRQPWDDDDAFSGALVHRRTQLAAVLVAAHRHDQEREVERELAELDRDLAAGVGALPKDRLAELRKRYLGQL